MSTMGIANITLKKVWGNHSALTHCSRRQWNNGSGEKLGNAGKETGRWRNQVPRATSPGLSDWKKMTDVGKSGKIGRERARAQAWAPESPILFPLTVQGYHISSLKLAAWEYLYHKEQQMLPNGLPSPSPREQSNSTLLPEPVRTQQPLEFSQQQLHRDQIQTLIRQGFGLISQQKSLGLLTWAGPIGP